MAYLKGTAFRVYWNTGTDGTAVNTAIGKETDLNFSWEVDTIDTTNKSSGNYKEHMESFRSVTATFTAHMDEGDSAIDKMLNDVQSGVAQRAGLQFKTINSEIYSFTGTLTNLTYAAAHDGIVDVSGTIESSGSVTIT